MKRIYLLLLYILTGLTAFFISAYFLFTQLKANTESIFLWLIPAFISVLVVVSMVKLVSIFLREAKKGEARKLSMKHFTLKMWIHFIAVSVLYFTGIHFVMPVHSGVRVLYLDVAQSIFIAGIMTYISAKVYKHLAQ